MRLLLYIVFAGVFTVSFPLLAETTSSQRQTEATVASGACRTECVYSLTDSWRTRNHQPITARLTRHRPRYIMLHHSGVKQSTRELPDLLRRLYNYSVNDRRWGDVPYHFYIDKNANVMGGRSVEFQPDTNTEFNPAGYINIVIDGNYTRSGGDRMTDAQRRALARLVRDIKSRYSITSVTTHSAVARTECPGDISAAGL